LSVAFQTTSSWPGAWLTTVGVDPMARVPTCSSCGVSHVSAPNQPLCDWTCQRSPELSAQNASTWPAAGDTTAGLEAALAGVIAAGEGCQDWLRYARSWSSESDPRQMTSMS